MSDEAKLGLIAGILAVVGVAVFGYPQDQPKTESKPALRSGTATAPPPLAPAAVVPAR